MSARAGERSPGVWTAGPGVARRPRPPWQERAHLPGVLDDGQAVPPDADAAAAGGCSRRGVGRGGRRDGRGLGCGGGDAFGCRLLRGRVQVNQACSHSCITATAVIVFVSDPIRNTVPSLIGRPGVTSATPWQKYCTVEPSRTAATATRRTATGAIVLCRSSLETRADESLRVRLTAVIVLVPSTE